MRNTLLIIAFLTISTFARSQNYHVKCIIKDSFSLQPLEKANVLDAVTKQVFTTDKNGTCYFLKKDILSLKITYLGYENLSKIIDLKKLQNNKTDTIQIDIFLTKSSKTLKTITIQDQKKEGILNQQQWLFDYELEGSNTWLLFSNGKKNRIVAFDQYSDTIIDTTVPAEIFQIDKVMDEKLIISSKDSSYYIIQKNNSIKILERFSKTSFIEKIQPLIIFKGAGIVPHKNAQFASTKFKMVDLKTGNSFYLSTYQNSERSKYNINQSINISSQNDYLESIGKNYLGDIYISDTKDELRQVRNLHKNEWELEFNHLNNLEIFLKIVRDSIYIINHDNDSIYVFNNTGKFTRKIKTFYKNKPIHYPCIIADEEGQELYYSYTYKDACYLEAIDLDSGESKKTIKIKKTFPQKIRIRNGFIYFMQNKKGDIDSNNNLYLQAITK